MDILPLLLIVLSAILHCTWNLLLKKNQASFASYVLMNTTDILVWWHLNLWVPVPIWHQSPLFYLMVLGCVCCDLTYGQCLLAAYKRLDMSISYPMMRSLPLIFTMIITTVLHLGNSLTRVDVIGMLIVFCGCLIMPLKAFSDFKLRNYFNKNIILVVIVALGTTGYTIFDSQGQKILSASVADMNLSPIMLSVCYFAVRSVCLNTSGWITCLLVPYYRKDLLPTFKYHWKSVFFAGFCSSLTYVLVLLAMNFVSNVSFVQVFRQVGLPIGMFMAVIFLHEKCTLTKIVGVILIVTGLVLCAI